MGRFVCSLMMFAIVLVPIKKVYADELQIATESFLNEEIDFLPFVDFLLKRGNLEADLSEVIYEAKLSQVPNNIKRDRLVELAVQLDRRLEWSDERSRYWMVSGVVVGAVIGVSTVDTSYAGDVFGPAFTLIEGAFQFFGGAVAGGGVGYLSNKVHKKIRHDNQLNQKLINSFLKDCSVFLN